jgi:hypothetical protein
MIRDLLVLVVLGFAAWLVETYVTMADYIKAVFRFVVIILLIFWVLHIFGIADFPIVHH